METLKSKNVFNNELLKNIQKESNKVAIKNNKNEIIKYVPIYYLMIFDYFNAILERWLGTATEKCITLDETFDVDKTEYFVKMIELSVYDNTKIINNDQEAIYFCEVADKYSMKSYLVQNVLEKIDWTISWELLINIAKDYDGCIMGPYTKLLFKKVFNYISANEIELKKIPCEGFQLDMIRQLIIDYFKSDDCNKYSEEILLDQLSIVVKEYDLSFEIFNELLSFIRWFYIAEDNFKKLKASHPQFIISDEEEKKILSKINKRLELIENYKQSYDKSIESFYYSEDLGDLDARSIGKYVKEIDLTSFFRRYFPIMIRICTTTTKLDYSYVAIHHKDHQIIFSVCQDRNINIIMSIYSKIKGSEWKPALESIAIKLSTFLKFEFSLPNRNIKFVKFVFHSIWND